MLDITFPNLKNMEVTQHPKTLENIVKDTMFKIPIYQREYSWELEQVSDLYYDILNSNEKEGHFLGSILVYKSVNEEREEVIDGQQRLTTIFLLLNSIKQQLPLEKKFDKAKELINSLLFKRNSSVLEEDTDDEIRLELGRRDKDLFKSIIQSRIVRASILSNPKKSHNLLRATIDFFDQKLETLVTEQGETGLGKLIDKIKASTFIVMTAEKEYDKLLLFKILNTRGIDLSESDLIKNEICISAKKIDVSAAIEIWDEIRGLLDNAKANIDLFLFHYINSYGESLTLRKKVEARINLNVNQNNYPFVPERFLFPVFQEKLKEVIDTNDFLNEMVINAKNYADFISPTDDIYLTSLRSMNFTKCYPLLLKSKRVLSDNNFANIKRMVECLSFIHSIAGNDPKDLEDFYYKLINQLNSDADMTAIIEKFETHPTIIDEEKFRNQFISATVKDSISKMILERIANFDSDQIGVNLEEQKDITLEHIMPKKPSGEWLTIYKADSSNYDLQVKRLGNLTLLLDKANKRIGNKDFSIKKVAYAKERLTMTNSLKDKPGWDEKQINFRQADLYKIAKQVWRMKLS